MPTVSVNAKEIWDLIGREHIESRYRDDPKYKDADDDTKFDQLCFEYGIELDEVRMQGRMDGMDGMMMIFFLFCCYGWMDE